MNKWCVGFCLVVLAVQHAQAASPTEQRFHMTQNGKTMSADDFDAWMRAQNVRIVGQRLGAAHTPSTPLSSSTTSPSNISSSNGTSLKEKTLKDAWVDGAGAAGTKMPNGDLVFEAAVQTPSNALPPLPPSSLPPVSSAQGALGIMPAYAVGGSVQEKTRTEERMRSTPRGSIVPFGK